MDAWVYFFRGLCRSAVYAWHEEKNRDGCLIVNRES
jgi:hypothetical protein